MPVDGQGQPLDVLVNPLGVISRGNPSQLVEAILGKIAAARGKPYKVEGFGDDDMVEFAIKELEKSGLSDTESVFDPVMNREIPGILVGKRFFMKLHHTAESKLSGRGLGVYTSEGIPAQAPGGEDSPKRIGGGEMQGLVAHGACFTGATRVLTQEYGWLQISKIVSKRLPLLVASFNSVTKRIEYKKIIDWLCRSVPETDFVEVRTKARVGSRRGGIAGYRRGIKCTRGHEFHTPTGKVQAADLQAGHEILSIGPAIADWQVAALYGSVMGDSYISPQGRVSFVHGHTQYDYLTWKYRLFKNMVRTAPKKQRLSAGGFAKKPTMRFCTLTNHISQRMRVEMYGQHKKVPEGIVAKMGWYGLGIWFADDGGCCNRNGKASVYRLHTNAFTVAECERLALELQEFTGAPWRVVIRSVAGKKRYPILTLTNSEPNTLVDFAKQLGPYLPPMFGYKLGNRYAGVVGSAWSKLVTPQHLTVNPCIVTSIEPYELKSYESGLVYNITVEDNHNYIVHGVLVGNSEVIKDVKNVRGQRNDEYWKAMMMGHPPPTPAIPMAYKKMLALLQGAGINVKKQGNYLHLLAMTDKDVDKMSSGAVNNPDTVKWMSEYGRGSFGEKSMEPVKGGLFDRGITGGHGGCFHPMTQIWTEQGYMSIGDIVLERRRVKVWSYNHAAQAFELKPITNWFKNIAENGISSSVFQDEKRGVDAMRASTLWGTPTHQVYDKHGHCQDLAVATSLQAVTECASLTLRQFLDGCMLGDGHVSEAGNYDEVHCATQKEYAMWKVRVLGTLVPAKNIREFIDTSGGLIRSKVYFRSITHPVLKELRRAWYGSEKKHVSKRQAVAAMNPVSLSVWFMDDGSCFRRVDRNTIQIALSTHGFNKKSVRNLATALYKVYGITSRICRDNKKYGKKPYGWYLLITAKDAHYFLNIVAPYIHPSMVYKLPKRPITSYCKCGREILRIRDICNMCLLDEARNCGAHKLPKHIRRRLGGTVGVRQIIARPASLPTDQILELTAWESWISMLGTGCSRVEAGSCLSYCLSDIPARYRQKTGLRWENTRSVYDIEVADNHNYFANGILVSNSRWSHIELSEPMPQPVMEDPIRTLLGLTKSQYEDVIAGKKEIPGVGTGTRAVAEALKRMKVPSMIEGLRDTVRSTSSATGRDLALKKLKYLETFERQGTKPADLVVNKVGVLPPIFRPISGTKDFTMVAGANRLYLDMMQADKNLVAMRGQLGDDVVGEARLNLYKSFKAVTGLGDPVKTDTKSHRVKGLLSEIFGKSPKMGIVQRRLLGTPVDMAGRSVIIPNPELDMDQIGIPEEMAWKLYSPFAIRRMIKGMGNRPDARSQAVRLVSEHAPRAREAIVAEMAERPVLATRAPVLHKYGIMAFNPVMTPGKTLQTSPQIIAGFGGDYDGDCDFSAVIIGVDRPLLTRYHEVYGKTFMEDRLMSARYKAKLPVLTDKEVFIFNLEDIPRAALMSTKDGEKGCIDFYHVPAGMKVLAYDEKTGAVSWSKVGAFSIHHDREIEVVNLKSGRQIITDDDPRAVYGVPAGSLKLGRFTPTEAEKQKVLVPRADRLDVPELISDIDIDKVDDPYWKTRQLNSSIKLDFDFGYLVGAMAGDGWSSSDKAVCLAATTKAVADKVDQVINALFDGKVPKRGCVVSKTSYGKSIKYSWPSTELAKLIKPLVGSGARNKHLPPYFLTGPKEFRFGLYAGLMDTDGGVGVSNAKTKPQLMANYYSTSLRLIYEVKLLASSLGIKGRITATATPAGKRSWVCMFSGPDIKRWAGRGLLNREKLSKIVTTEVNAESTVSARNDLVPISRALATHVLGQINSKRGAPRADKTMYANIWRGREVGYLSRLTAKRLESFVSRDSVLKHVDGKQWLAVVDSDVTWDQVVSVDRTGMVETGYDLTVPGKETFLSVDGLVLSNTMNFHVVSSDKAIVDAKDKMLPSRNLRSPADFATMWKPRQEFLQGLYMASTRKSGKRTLPAYDSAKDVIAAFKRGELNIEDAITMKE